ncbi:energy transducer TonB [Aurantibacter crassamenti]|uniref:energy transducer TonB n=1 Tax=Aurantibacter crassamenti TaxID=1837375 RepID=UPI00193A26FC|nr:energy transducer TonB [Aurantibacter crassamenti]MBM1108163.1 energy transducer TonB [Aurantibacter crassamenti]
MKPKKNPQKDLNKNRGLYFVSGLALIMLLTYVALEWKFYDKIDYVSANMNPVDELIEEVPLIIQLTPPPPPPPPVAPIEIKIVEDEKEIIETILESTESDTDKEILEVTHVIYEEVEPEIKVDWVSIEEVPVFPGCEKEKDKRACFQKMINKHISKVFRYPEPAQEIGIEGKVYTQFTIEADGTIGNILLRGPDKILEKEANRIIEKLPKMKPGKQREKNVKVAFTIPINFQLQ